MGVVNASRPEPDFRAVCALAGKIAQRGRGKNLISKRWLKSQNRKHGWCFHFSENPTFYEKGSPVNSCFSFLFAFPVSPLLSTDFLFALFMSLN
jgi:hypothetical protein